MIQPKVSGFQISDTDGQQEKWHTVEAKQLKAEEQAADWTVGHTAKDRNHTAGCSQRWIKTGQLTEDASKGSTHKQGRNNLTALETTAKGDGGKDHLQQKSSGNHFPGDCLCNDIHAGTQIVSSVKELYQQDNQQRTGDYADPFIWYILLIQMFCAVQDSAE